MDVRRPTSDPGTGPGVDRFFSSSSSELDALFRASPPGEIPDGEQRGSVLLFPGTPLARLIARVAYPLAWQGKVVERDRGELKNRVTPLRLKAIRAKVFLGDSWVDQAPCVVIDYSRTSLVARPVRDEIRLVAPGVYLGVVWLGHRRVARFLLRSPD